MSTAERAKCKKCEKCDGHGFYLSDEGDNPRLCCEICGGNGFAGLPWLRRPRWRWDALISGYVFTLDIMCDGEKLYEYGISEGVIEALPRPQWGASA